LLTTWQIYDPLSVPPSDAEEGDTETKLPHGESKPLRLKKLAKTHGPITKQAHLSSFALREDTELGRGALQVSQLPSMESKRALPVKPALADSARADLPVHSEASEARQRKLFAGDDDFKVRNNLSFSLSQSLYLVLTFFSSPFVSLLSRPLVPR